jgi:AcrR family transcriptional regulator
VAVDAGDRASGSAANGRRLAANQADRRRRVVQAAVELAAEGGYDLVQMRDVAARAGVALGTIYRYFESKDQLLGAAFVEWVGELERRLAQRPPVGNNPVERVVDVLRRASRATERNQQLSSALITALVGGPPARQTTTPGPAKSGSAGRYQDQVEQALVRILEGALQGMPPDARDGVVRLLTHVWFAALIGWVHGWRGVRSVSDELEFAARFLLDRV